MLQFSQTLTSIGNHSRYWQSVEQEGQGFRLPSLRWMLKQLGDGIPVDVSDRPRDMNKIARDKVTKDRRGGAFYLLLIFLYTGVVT